MISGKFGIENGGWQSKEVKESYRVRLRKSIRKN